MLMYSPFVRRRPALGPTQRRSDGSGFPEPGEEEGLIEPTGASGSGATWSPMVPVQPSKPAHSASAGIPPEVIFMIASVPRGSPERLTVRRNHEGGGGGGRGEEGGGGGGKESIVGVGEEGGGGGARGGEGGEVEGWGRGGGWVVGGSVGGGAPLSGVQGSGPDAFLEREPGRRHFAGRSCR